MEHTEGKAEREKKKQTMVTDNYREDYSNSTLCCCLSCRALARSARRRRRLLAYDPLASVPVHVPGEVTLPAP